MVLVLEMRRLSLLAMPALLLRPETMDWKIQGRPARAQARPEAPGAATAVQPCSFATAGFISGIFHLREQNQERKDRAKGLSIWLS